jgi:hypothetical protein
MAGATAATDTYQSNTQLYQEGASCPLRILARC